MGPRPCGRGRLNRSAQIVGYGQLQWGHGLAAVDGGGGPLGCRRTLRASMGPRPCGRGRRYARAMDMANAARLQWGHGLAAVDGSWCPSGTDPAPCFNGATALRPWTAAPAAP